MFIVIQAKLHHGGYVLGALEVSGEQAKDNTTIVKQV
jgi:hypothetical protein